MNAWLKRWGYDHWVTQDQQYGIVFDPSLYSYDLYIYAHRLRILVFHMKKAATL